jgi:hypothetical protein
MSDAVPFRPNPRPDPGSLAARSTAQVEARLSRTNYFDGRLLTAEDLNRDHAYLDGRLLDIGLAGGDGVILGFELKLDGNRFLRVGSGAGVTPSGRMLLLDRPADRPLGADLADPGRLATLNGNEVRGLGTGLHAVVLMHREVGSDVAEIFPRDLAARRESGFNTNTELLEIVLVPLPLRRPLGSELAARAGLARMLLGRPEIAAALPEDGLALGLLATEGGSPRWVDPWLLRRVRRDRSDPAGMQRDLAAHYEALLGDVLADRAARGLQGGFRATDAFTLMPPAGTLPKVGFDLAAGSQIYFAEQARVWVAPVRADEVAVLQEESMAYAPLDLASGEPFEIVVLAPLSPADFATFGRALEQPRRSAAAPAPQPFQWSDRIGLPRLEPLRLRLLPEPGAPLDTDAPTWKAIWEKVPARLPYVVRPAHAAATGVSAVMLAAGFAPKTPTEAAEMADVRAQLARTQESVQKSAAELEAARKAQQEAAQKHAAELEAARKAQQQAQADAAAARAAAEQAGAGAGAQAAAMTAANAARDRAIAERNEARRQLVACQARGKARDDALDLLNKRLITIDRRPLPWSTDWPDDPRLRETVLAGVDGLLAQRDTRITELDTAVKARDADLTKLRTEMTQGDARITELDAAVKARDTDLTKLRTEMTQRYTRIRELDAAVKARDTDITKLRTDIASRDARIAELGTTIQTRDAEIGRMRTDITTRDARITELGTTIQTRDAEIGRMRADTQRLNADLTRLNTELTTFRGRPIR